MINSSVLVVVPPFASCEFPSLEAGVIAGVFRNAGVAVEVLYLAHEFAERVSRKLYTQIANIPPPRGIADWVGAGCLSRSAFDSSVRNIRQHTDFEAYVASFGISEGEYATLNATREAWQEYALGFVRTIKEREWSHVIFVCHHQQLGSCLLLAHLLGESGETRPLLVSGAYLSSFEQARALLTASPSIKGVIYAGGATSLAAYMNEILCGVDAPGFATRAMPAAVNREPALHHANLAAVPQFDDFYLRFTEEPILSVLPIQASQGCSWADHRHCSFCGLIPSGEKHAAKSGEAVFTELTEQVAKYEAMHFVAADHLLSPTHEHTLLPSLGEADLDVTGFFEIRATSKKAALRRLLDAKVFTVEIGIESFDKESLKRMRKGTTPLINMRVLKWAHEIGLEPYWTWLYGFPWETAQGLSRQIELVKRITHLPPPLHATPFRLERDSPFWKAGEESGLSSRRPAEAALHTFPFRYEVIDRLVRLFDYEIAGHGVAFDKSSAEVQSLVAAWKEHWRWDMLDYRVGPSFVKICDQRQRPLTVTLRGWRAVVFSRLDDICSLDLLCKELPGVMYSDVAEFVTEMTALGYVCRDGDQFISVVPRHNALRTHLAKSSSLKSTSPGEVKTLPAAGLG